MSAALAVRDLRKSFGGLPAADGVTLEVAEGERHLIIGPNGAGKTTLFNLISGDLRADSGSVRLFGEEVAGLRPDQRARRGMARTYQILTLFPRDTLAHNIVMSVLGMSPSRWRMLAPLAGMGELHDKARAALARVGLAPLADRLVGEVSYGEKRRLEMLLDEPLAGLSAEERHAMLALLAQIPREVTVVMIEHDIDAALAFAERITVLHYGSVIVEGTRAEVVAHPRTREVYLGA